MFKKVLVYLLICYVIFIYLPPRTSSFLERHGLKEQVMEGLQLFVIWCSSLLFLAMAIYDARFNSWANFTVDAVAIIAIFVCLNDYHAQYFYFWVFISGLIIGVPVGILTIKSRNKCEQTQIKT